MLYRSQAGPEIRDAEVKRKNISRINWGQPLRTRTVPV